MIELQNFHKYYNDHAVFQNFSCAISKGESVGIYGPSGCGKTTLLHCICGLDLKYTGEIILDGVLMTSKMKPHKRNSSFVMQEPTLWAHMTVKENILFSLEKRERKASNEQFRSVCNNLQISDLLDRYPDAISGGQAKRVSMARAMMAPKDMLLLDEPLTNVDVDTKQAITKYLKQEFLHKKTILYVSHDLRELEEICDRIIYLE